MENLLASSTSYDVSLYPRDLEPGTDQGGLKNLILQLSRSPVRPVFRLTIRGLFFQSKVASKLRKRRNPTCGELQAGQNRSTSTFALLAARRAALRGNLVKAQSPCSPTRDICNGKGKFRTNFRPFPFSKSPGKVFSPFSLTPQEK